MGYNPEENRKWWETRANAIQMYYINKIDNPDAIRQGFSTNQACAWDLIWRTLPILVVGDKPFADKLCAVVESAARIAIETHDFEFIFYHSVPEIIDGKTIGIMKDRSFGLTEKMKRIELLSGFYNSYKAMYFANLFRNGQSDIGLLQELGQRSYDLYDFCGRKSFSLDSTFVPMNDLILAGRYNDAIEIYHRDYKKALKGLPADKRYINNKLHVLYLLAEYLNGNESFRASAEYGMGYWHTKNKVWNLYTEAVWNVLFFAIMYGKCFANNDNIYDIIHDLRGY